jgi:uncharacterized membrane protein YvlD (DUF360 family)
MDILRKLVLTFVINAAAVALAATIVPGMTYTGGWQGLLTITLVLAGVNMLIKPALNLLELPAEMVLVTLLTIIVNAIVLLIMANTIVGFNLYPFVFPGFSRGKIFVAPFNLPTWGTAIVGAILIGILVWFFYWLTGMSKERHGK